jgi:hypothetical protein
MASAGAKATECVDLFVAGDVALEGPPGSGLAQVLQQFVGLALQPLHLVRQHQGGSRLGQLLRHAVGNTAFIRQAKDNGHFPLQIDHSAPQNVLNT